MRFKFMHKKGRTDAKPSWEWRDISPKWIDVGLFAVVLVIQIIWMIQMLRIPLAD